MWLKMSKLIGRIEEITPDGRLIAECSELPDMNEPIYDGNRKKIGVVKRIFGPVDRPYISITPETAISEKLRNTNIYKEGRDNGKDKGRNRRS